jgi:hypothetical protein
MGTITEKLRLELDKLAKEAKDEETLREILKMDIRLQRGSLKGKAKPGPLTYEEKERALKMLLKEKGLKWPSF